MIQDGQTSQTVIGEHSIKGQPGMCRLRIAILTNASTAPPQPNFAMQRSSIAIEAAGGVARAFSRNWRVYRECVRV